MAASSAIMSVPTPTKMAAKLVHHRINVTANASLTVKETKPSARRQTLQADVFRILKSSRQQSAMIDLSEWNRSKIFKIIGSV